MEVVRGKKLTTASIFCRRFMNNFKNPSDDAIHLNELMVLLQGIGPENAELQQMISKAKMAYVDSKHQRAISQIHSEDKYRNGRWKTYIYENNKRRTVEYKTKEEVYEFLFQFYKEQDEKEKTYEEVFEMLVSHKENVLGRAEQTVSEDRRYFGFISKKLREKVISEISEEDICSWLIDSYLPKHPKPEALKKIIQIQKQVFKFACKKHICVMNPIEYLEYGDYMHFCNLKGKTNEEHSFSDEEIAKLKAYALKHLKNPHAVMILVAIETGLRVGELAALKKTDVADGYIHVHRQQLREYTDKHQGFIDVNYTKNEKKRPKGGRYIPITKECEKALKYAKELPGESEALFHDADGKPVQKDSYSQYLRRRCRELDICVTNNHAFRVAFNSRLYEANINDMDRALILGHSAQTNTRHYSFSDRRRLDSVKNALCKLEE